jgi:hypothetical protein
MEVPAEKPVAVPQTVCKYLTKKNDSLPVFCFKELPARFKLSYLKIKGGRKEEQRQSLSLLSGTGVSRAQPFQPSEHISIKRNTHSRDDSIYEDTHSLFFKHRQQLSIFKRGGKKIF